MSPNYRHVPLSQRLGLSFQDSDYWKVDMQDAECFMYFVAGLRQVFGDGDTLYIEGTQLDPEVAAFYDSLPRLQTPQIMQLLRRPSAKRVHIPLSRENHKRLSTLATCKTFAGICDAVLVYGGGKVLMDGSRLGDRRVLFSGDIPEPKIRKFCATKVHGSYEWVEEGKDLV